ncbi:transcriptional regulator, TetR family [Alteromonadaceae bacterium Bs31]|nr:transcriptional regulator, TetR family [Alteromonadaceae bacterium Bs31]
MPWNAEHKLKSSEKILDSAASLFTAKGFDGVSIDDIMKDAGLTRGAFYAHFSSKSDIYNQAVLHGAAKAKHLIEKNNVKSALSLAQEYLRIGTPGSEQAYCPLAFLITDIGQRDEDIKSTYTKVLKGYQNIYQNMGLSREQAIQVTIMLIGGLALSRAVTDRKLKRDILHNCQEAVEHLMPT